MSTTTYLELFKHDDPANNTSEFDVDKSLNENWDKIDENAREVSDNIDEIIDKVKEHIEEISNIKAKNTEQDKYISELEAENSRLREDLNGLPKRQASGESIDLSDSAEMRCELKISGNSEQETRSGKNLLNFNGFATKEISGVTITNNNDGSITLNGTATANISIRLSNQMNKTLTAGNYYFSSNSKGSVSGAFTTFMFGNNDAEDIRFATITEENKGFSTSIDYKKYWLWLYINSGITFTNYIMKPQLEAGTVKTDWELYGASPSPDYPSEVESCGDNINLFDKDNANKIQDTFIGITGSVGTATANQIVYVECKKNATITVQKKVSTRFRVATYSSTDIVGKTLSNVKVNDAGTSITITSGEKDTYLFVQYIGPDDKDNSATILKTLKIAYSSKETGYSEYGQGCINEVICNKNLLKIVDGTYTNQGITTIIKDSKIKSSGTTTTTYADINNISSLFDINIKSGCEYTFSRTKTSEYRLWIRLYNSASDIQDAMIAENSKSVTFIANSNYNKCYLFYTNFKADKTLSIDDFQVMIAEGSTVTDYEEHKSQTYTIPTQQPMRCVGDIRDTFIKKNNKWFERHYIQRVIFDGTENFVLSGSLKNTNRFSTNNYKSTFKNAMSSHFKYAYDYNLDEPHFYLNSSSLFLFVNNTISTVAELQAYLAEQYNAGTPVYVDYILETPLDIKCTEEQNTILDKIEKEAKTYKNITHMYSTDNVSPVIDVTYKKDIETLITNIEQAILSQGGNI